MTTAFLDTSGWLAALSPREAHHAAARKLYEQWVEGGARLITTNLVVAEMQLLLSRARGGAAALQFLDSLYQDPTHTVLFVDRDLERAAMDRWLRLFADQRVSLADAVSFEVMRAHRVPPGAHTRRPLPARRLRSSPLIARRVRLRDAS